MPTYNKLAAFYVTPHTEVEGKGKAIFATGRGAP